MSFGKCEDCGAELVSCGGGTGDVICPTIHNFALDHPQIGGVNHQTIKWWEEHQKIARKVFEEFWKPIVCNPDGSLNLDKVILELHDFSIVMDECSKVYSYITGGLISKPNTIASAVIDKADEVIEKHLDEARKEEREACRERAQAEGASQAVLDAIMKGD